MSLTTDENQRKSYIAHLVNGIDNLLAPIEANMDAPEPADEIEEKVTHKLREIQRTASLPGFRPGKVPVPVLRKRFGQAVLGEVLERKTYVPR